MSRPLGTGGEVPLEFIRQVLVEGLLALASDPIRLDDALERHDEGADRSDAEKYSAEAKRRIKAILQTSGIEVALQYPADNAKTPTISIVVMSETENRANAPCGDLMGHETEIIGVAQSSSSDDWITAPTSKAYRRETLITQFNAPVQVGIWAQAGDVFLLFRLLRQVLLAEKPRLEEAGILEASMSTGGFNPDPERWPDFPMVLTITYSLVYDYRFDKRTGPVPHHLWLDDCAGAN